MLRQPTSCVLVLYLAAAGGSAVARTESMVPGVATIIARMTEARAENRSRLRPYVVTRDYQLFGSERHNARSQVIADLSFFPPDFKKYVILKTSAGGLGERVVRRALEAETEVTKHSRSTDISPDNYDFRFLAESNADGRRCYVLELLPKRQEATLLRGNIWVDATTYLIHRAEGQPAKSASWWLRDVRILLLYGDVGGMWLQTSSEATAHVRIAGPYSIVSRDIKYRIGADAVARSVAEPSF